MLNRSISTNNTPSFLNGSTFHNHPSTLSTSPPSFSFSKPLYLKGFTSLKQHYTGSLIKPFIEKQLLDPSDYEDLSQPSFLKTAYTLRQVIKQKELEQEAVMMEAPKKEYRAQTKGRFANIGINSPA